MRADVAVRFNGVEQTLAGVLVALVDVPVLAKSGTVLCLPSEIVEVLRVERFHDLFGASSLESSHDLSNCFINRKLSPKEVAATVWQFFSL